jgi:signal transduction histidine kinase
MDRDRARKRTMAGRHARDIQELTASIAHEIRNPITAAKSLVQQMGEDPNADDNVEYASVALEELERVERSVSHLLRFARDEDVALHAVRLGEVVEGALAMLAERADKEGVELRHELDTDGELEGDPEQLRRVVLNLVGNSLDALHDANTASPRVDVQLGDDLSGSEVWLRVRDNGPGIPADERARIFRPFHTSKTAGTGLGLAITKKIVEAHEGSIEVEAGPGGGAEFLVTLPKQRAG